MYQIDSLISTIKNHKGTLSDVIRTRLQKLETTLAELSLLNKNFNIATNNHYICCNFEDLFNSFFLTFRFSEKYIYFYPFTKNISTQSFSFDELSNFQNYITDNKEYLENISSKFYELFYLAIEVRKEFNTFVKDFSNSQRPIVLKFLKDNSLSEVAIKRALKNKNQYSDFLLFNKNQYSAILLFKLKNNKITFSTLNDNYYNFKYNKNYAYFSIVCDYEYDDYSTSLQTSFNKHDILKFFELYNTDKGLFIDVEKAFNNIQLIKNIDNF